MKKITKYQEIIFLTIVTLFWFAQYVYIPYQTMFLTASGVTSKFVGIIVGAYGISQLLLRLPVGLMADGVGRHKLFILTGALASGAASLLRITWPGGTGFLFANLLSGLASSMWISFMVFYTDSYSPVHQQAATSRIILFNNLGILLGFITSTLLYAAAGMKVICIMSFGAGILAFLLAFYIKESPADSHERLPAAELVKVCSGKRLWMFAFIALIQQGIQLSTTMSFTTQILKDLGASAALLGLASIVYMLSAVSFSAFASSEFCRKKGTEFWIPAVLIVMAVYCILVPIVNSIPMVFLLQLLPGMATGILFSYATSEAMKEVPKDKKSTAMGFYQAFYAVGMTLFPVITGNIATKINLTAGYFLLAGISVIGSVSVFIYYRAAKKAMPV